MKIETIKATTIVNFSLFFLTLFCLNTTQAFRSSLPKMTFLTKTMGIKPSLLGLQKSVRPFSQSIKCQTEDVWFSGDECRMRALFGGVEQPDVLSMSSLPKSTDFFEKASLKELEDLLSHYFHSADEHNYYVPFKFYGSEYAGPIDEAECRLFAKVYFFNTVMTEKFIYEALENNDTDKFKQCVNFMNALKKELEPYKKVENDKRGFREYPHLDSLNHSLTCNVLQLNRTPEVGKFLEILHQNNQLEFKSLVDERRVNMFSETFEIEKQPLEEDKVFKLSLLLKLRGVDNKEIEQFFEVDKLPHDRKLLIANPHAISFLKSLENIPQISSVVNDASLTYCAKRCIKENLEVPSTTGPVNEEVYEQALESQKVIHGFRVYGEDLKQALAAVKKFRKKVCNSIPDNDEIFNIKNCYYKIYKITGVYPEPNESNREFLKRLSECKVCKEYAKLENALEKRKNELFKQSKDASK